MKNIFLILPYRVEIYNIFHLNLLNFLYGSVLAMNNNIKLMENKVKKVKLLGEKYV